MTTHIPLIVFEPKLHTYSRYMDGKHEFTVKADIPLSKIDIETLRTNPGALIDLTEPPQTA